MGTAPLTGGRRRAADAVSEWFPLALILAGYIGSARAARALGRPRRDRQLAACERRVFGHIPSVAIQRRVGQPAPPWLAVPLTGLYLSHVATVPALSAWLYVHNRDRWRHWRLTLSVASWLGLATYVLFPAAPPWMASDLDIIEPVHRTALEGLSHLGLRDVQDVGVGVQGRINTVAALPSMHSAYALLATVALREQLPPRAKRAVLAYPPAMAAALIATGEHYAVDVLLGFAYAWGAGQILRMDAVARPGRS